MCKKKEKKRIPAILLVLAILFSMLAGSTIPVQAADGTITFDPGETIYYGSFFTTKMSFDDINTAYCVEPLQYTPAAGPYEYNLLGSDSPIRKALYYLPGGYGYETDIQSRYLSGWTENDAYVIGHLVVSYIYAGYDGESGVFHGAPQSFIDKTVELTSVIGSLPAPPAKFRAFLVPVKGKQTFTGSWYQKPYGWIELQKSTANPELSDGNANYSLEGAEYGVFQGEELITTLTTDENGYAKSEDLDTGAYTLRELEASPGYALDMNGYEVTVTAETTATVAVKEVPQNQPLELLLQKVDGETGKDSPQGAASLEGAEFTIRYYQRGMTPRAEEAEPTRTWVFRTDAEGKVHFAQEYLVSGDAFYYAMDGITPCLPLGMVTIQETKAPKGYQVNEEVVTQMITAEGTGETVTCYNAPTVPEQVYRGDLEFVKVSDGDLARLADVPFSLTSKTTGESHTLVTDKNGYGSTASDWNKHSHNTNAGKTSSDGIWFGEGEVDDEKGALPYDTYVVEEQRCKANEGMSLLTFEVSVYKDAVTVDLGTLTNDRIEITTTAVDSETHTHLSNPDEKVTLIDTVLYEGLKKGKEYKVIGTLMDKETKEPLLIAGEPVTAETTFKAKKANGSVEVKFVFDGSALQGKTVVVFEELYQEELKLAVHADIEDTDQTIYFPLIQTTAKERTEIRKSDRRRQRSSWIRSPIRT